MCHIARFDKILMTDKKKTKIINKYQKIIVLMSVTNSFHLYDAKLRAVRSKSGHLSYALYLKYYK